MTHIKAALLITVCAGLAGCTGLRTDGGIEVGSAPVCAPGVDLGATRVVLKTDWRSDQKEPAERERIAQDVIRAVFQDLPCGRYVEDGGAGETTIDTLVEITLREFGPELVLTVPALWSTNTDVDATIRVIDKGSGALRFAASERRKEGGAFSVKSLADVPATFEDLLKDWVGTDDDDRRS
ncbi:MAG: hypothetical protein AAGJ94_04870 [Pseudomonadota bacterium]